MAIKDEIKNELSPSSSFTAFKVWIILYDDKLKREFMDLIESIYVSVPGALTSSSASLRESSGK
jgi:abortive infection bacteriophage resistance protein